MDHTHFYLAMPCRCYKPTVASNAFWYCYIYCDLRLPVQAKDLWTYADRNARLYSINFTPLKTPLFSIITTHHSIPLLCPPPFLRLFQKLSLSFCLSNQKKKKNVQHNAQQQLIRRRMRKQKTHTLPIMRPPNRLRQRRANIHNLQLLTSLHLPLHGHRIRYHNS
jgi:hypothetical protein